MANRYVVKKQWRGVGNNEYDVFFRDTEKALEKAGCIGKHNTEVYAVMAPRKPEKGEKPEEAFTVIADCYARVDANKVRDALNKVVR